MKIDILHRRTGTVLYSGDHDDHGAAILAAIKSRANLRGADLSGANLRRANLRRANLSGANLSGADLSFADLSFADLSGADLSFADLSGADLSGADLSGAYLSGAYLSRADLSGANLRRANLRRADLSGAYLSRAVGLNKHLVTPLLMLRYQPGPIRSFKLVTKDGSSPIAPGCGHAAIQYALGGEFVASANTDENEQCGAGINLASLDWCLREWKTGWRVLIAEHTAEDIAAIPTASDGKYRVHRCRIVGEVDLAAIGWPEEVKR